MRRGILISVLILVCSLIAVPMWMGEAKAAAKEPIKIGSICEFAGACYMYCETGLNGLRIAVDEINAKGGILGRKLDIIVRDTEAKVDVGVRELKD